jgi:AcrR family transcriptional regulator
MAGHVGTKGVPRADREEQILDIAGEEFGTRGYGAASVAEIAKRAGVSKPLIYGYFGSRDQLHEACVRRAGEPLVAAVAAAQIDGPAHIRAARTLRAIFGVLEQRRYGWAVLYDPTLPSTGPAGEVAHSYRKALNEMGAEGAAGVLAAVGNDDADDRALLTRIWFGTVTAAVQWWNDHPDSSGADITARCERIFGLLAPTSRAKSG